jgi:hypothetical protein
LTLYSHPSLNNLCTICTRTSSTNPKKTCPASKLLFHPKNPRKSPGASHEQSRSYLRNLTLGRRPQTCIVRVLRGCWLRQLTS